MAEEDKRPVGSLMDTGVPSQMDEEDLKAEMEIELPGALDSNVKPTIWTLKSRLMTTVV